MRSSRHHRGLGARRSNFGRNPGAPACLFAAVAVLAFLGSCGDFTLFGEENLPYVDLQVSPLDPLPCSEQMVSVDASGSVDPLDEAIAFVWALTVPPGSNATLADPSASQTTFTPDLAGAYLVTVMVVAERGEYATSQVTVNTTSSPVADAEADATQVTVGDTVTLDGSNSKNPLNADCSSDGLAFSWAFKDEEDKPSGSSAFINPPTAAQASFTADKPGSYRATLTVTPLGQTSPSSEASKTVTATEPGLTVGDLTVGDYGMTVASVTDTVFASVIDLEDLLKDAALTDAVEFPDPSSGTSFAGKITLSTDALDLGSIDPLTFAWSAATDAQYTLTGSAALTLDLTTSLSCDATATVSSGSVTPTSSTTASVVMTLSDVAITDESPEDCTTGCVNCDFDGTIVFTMNGEYQ